MLDEKDLQAIAAMLAPISERLDKLEGKVDKLEAKADTMKQELKTEISHEIRALIEVDVVRDLKALADGHKLLVEQMAKQETLEELRESVEDRLDVLDSIVKLHSHEIVRLKKAQ